MTDPKVTKSNSTNTSAAVPTDPQALASATAHAMWQRDRTAQALAMRIEHIAPGNATLSMPVRSDMVNGHHICHGGMIFTLADTAFAYA
jgi:acyl-CoA thioesterase